MLLWCQGALVHRATHRGHRTDHVIGSNLAASALAENDTLVLAIRPTLRTGGTDHIEQFADGTAAGSPPHRRSGPHRRDDACPVGRSPRHRHSKQDHDRYAADLTRATSAWADDTWCPPSTTPPRRRSRQTPRREAADGARATSARAERTDQVAVAGSRGPGHLRTGAADAGAVPDDRLRAGGAELLVRTDQTPEPSFCSAKAAGHPAQTEQTRGRTPTTVRAAGHLRAGGTDQTQYYRAEVHIGSPPRAEWTAQWC